MKIAIRGEGPTDIGVLDNGALTKGPMLILIEKLDCYKQLCNQLGCTDQYCFVEWVYIHKKDIMKSSQRNKKMVLRGKKVQRQAGVDTDTLKGFYANSESFGSLAREEESDMAIFFVDTDKDFCEDRYKQVKAGLKVHNYFDTGVPMIPTKISEAWLMCCLSQYQNCANHENATTDKTSALYPKNVCASSGNTTHEIAENCDPNRINMASFNRFRNDFKVAVNSYMHGTCE